MQNGNTARKENSDPGFKGVRISNPNWRKIRVRAVLENKTIEEFLMDLYYKVYKDDIPLSSE